MGTPGLGYALYLFDGKRGNRVPKNGYGICLYDSRNVPEPPIIKDPVLQIDQNSAGTVTFSLLSDAEGTIMSAGVEQPPSSKVMDYVCYMQSEIVVYRSKAVRNSTVPVYEEIWAGRVYSIKKDFYNNWKITAEGSLAYFNDFSMTEKKWEGAAGKAGDTIFDDIIKLYNDAINSTNIDPETQSARTIQHGGIIFAPLDRRITRGKYGGHTWKAATKISNSDTSFTISDGTTFMSALNSLLSRFGGFFEITHGYASDTGYSSTVINWREDNKYNTLKEGQTIVFGTNLLDYIEDLEDSEFFTALYPMGSTNETTEDESGTKKTTKKTLYINKVPAKSSDNMVHPAGSYYIYDKELVKQYGFIEKKEKWEIGDENELMRVAWDYYKDLHLGEPVVEVTAFDLKNLITTDLKKDEYYNISSLYLYDRIKISGYPFHSNDVKDIPITGIEIPLDKFPTDTKYTMSNKNLTKNALAPGNIPGTKPEENLPDPDPGGNEDPDPTKEDPVKYLHPVGSDLGIDANMPHYPMVYLRRSASQWQCSQFKLIYNKPDTGITSFFVFWKPSGWYDENVFSTEYIPDADKYDFLVTSYEQSPSGSGHYKHVSKTFAYGGNNLPSGGQGYEDNGYAAEYIPNSGNSGVKFYNSNETQTPATVTDQEFTFYSDNMSSVSSPMMRLKDVRAGNEELYNDYYEIANTDNEHPTTSNNPLNPYVSGAKEYFNHSEANITPDQNWRKHFTLSKQQITQKITGPESERDFTYKWIWDISIPESTKSDYHSSLNDAVESLPVLGDSTISTILSSIGAELLFDNASNRFDIKLNYSTSSLGGETVPIYRHLIDYWPEPNANTGRHMGLLASWTNAAKDTTVIYYSYINGATDSPIPMGGGHTIDTEMAINDDVGPNTRRLEELVTYWEDRAKSLTNLTVDTTKSPAGDYLQVSDVESLMRAILTSRDPSTCNVSKKIVVDGAEVTFDASVEFAGHAFPPGVYGLNHAKHILLHGSTNYPTDSLRITLNRIYKDAVQLKLIQTMKPLLILTKVKEIGSGGDEYGVIFSGGTYHTGNEPGTSYRNSIHVEDGKNILYDDILISADMQGHYNPIIYCKDVLMPGVGGLFEYYENEGEIAVKTNTVTHSKTSNASAPITVMTRCGGPYTKYISSGVYCQLCGSYSYGGPGFTWKTSWPVYKDGEPTKVPNYRTTKYDPGDGTNIWYKGVDMRGAPNLVQLPEDLSLNKPESQLYLEDLKYRVPVANGTDLFIRVGPAFIKNTPSQQSEGE